MKHPALDRPPSNLVAGRWVPIPGSALATHSPAHPDRVVWSGSPERDHVDRAVAGARSAFEAWSSFPRERRFDALRRFRALAAAEAPALAGLISDEVGKAMWDAKTEADLIAAKVDITLMHEPGANWGLSRVEGFETVLGPTRRARAFYRPHGVMAVVGPFNFPAHLPNGHIIPALAMGNTVVFKPSDKASAVGQRLVELLDRALTDAGAPPGVVGLVHGGAEIASSLVAHGEIDGVLFTGSFPVGRRILQANLDRPGRLIALEMGGNNAAIVCADADLRQAAIECVRSAFITTGQRCTCTRRVIVERGLAGRFIDAIARAAGSLTLGDPRAEPPVFMGPIISDRARDDVLSFQEQLAAAGARIVLAARAPEGEGWRLSPGIAEVERFTDALPGPAFDAGCDEEVFGPILRVSVADSLDEAIAQANATRFGLAASIFTRDDRAVEVFLAKVRAGCLNVNTGTAGASSKLPFGGLGLSGNHRPAGSSSLDYCSYPVASMIESGSAALLPPGMTFDDTGRA